MDIWGPHNAQNHNVASYYFIIVDDFSKGTSTFLMQFKNEIIPMIKIFIKTQFATYVKCIELIMQLIFLNLNLLIFSILGLIHERSCAHTPQQNGVVEKKHRHNRFWGEYVLTST